MLRPSIPSTDVAYVVGAHVLQPRLAQHFRDARAACPLRPGGRGDRRQRRLAGERRLVGAFDVRAGGAHAIVRQQRGHGSRHGVKL